MQFYNPRTSDQSNTCRYYRDKKSAEDVLSEDIVLEHKYDSSWRVCFLTYENRELWTRVVLVYAKCGSRRCNDFCTRYFYSPEFNILVAVDENNDSTRNFLRLCYHLHKAHCLREQEKALGQTECEKRWARHNRAKYN